MRRLTPLLALALLVALSACAPRYQDSTEAAVRAFADGPGGAQLVILEDGVAFSAGTLTRYDAVVYVGGNELVEDDPACEPHRNGVLCFVEKGGRDVHAGESVKVAVTGSNLSANVSYYLEDHPIPFGFYVRERLTE